MLEHEENAQETLEEEGIESAEGEAAVSDSDAADPQSEGGEESESDGAPAKQESERRQSREDHAASRQQVFLLMDAELFREKHPEVNLAQLERSDSFRRFCGSRFGVESLTALYEDYKAVVGGAENAVRAAAESRRRRSTGSGGGGGEVLSARQRASLDAWNRENPDMKMTAREFLGK